MIDLPILLFVSLLALLDAVNPWLISALVMLITAVLGSGHRPKHLGLFGASYLLAFCLTYATSGLLAWYGFMSAPIAIRSYIALGLGLGMVIIGLIYTKEFFWPRPRPSPMVSKRLAAMVQQRTHKVPRLGSIVVLGLLMGVVQLRFLTLPFLAAIAVVSLNFPVVSALWLIIVYTIIFIAPSVVILAGTMRQLKISSVQRFKEQLKSIAHLATGLMLIIAGWVVMLVANGGLNFG